MEKKKVLILQESLMLYRRPCWNILANQFDLTIGYYNKDGMKDRECKFRKHKFDIRRVGPFIIVKKLRRYAKDFDVVMFMDDLHVPSYCLLPFLPHKYKVIGWGIGFRVSYEHHYVVDRPHGIVDSIYGFIMKHCDAYVFYMKKAMEFWKDSGIDKTRRFAAPNTTEVLPVTIDENQKKDYLFVGTLYKGKGVDLLINAFSDALHTVECESKLYIIGGGEMKGELEKMISEKGLSSQIILVGPIYDEKELSSYFQKALLCISPTQGGLSCPKSMGYGVPFVTRKDAITGGEIYHMTPGENGIMYSEDHELSEILIDSMKNREKYIEMGKKAKDYYDNNATPSHMAQGAIDAINHVLNE